MKPWPTGCEAVIRGKIPIYVYDAEAMSMTIGTSCSSAQRPSFFPNSITIERDTTPPRRGKFLSEDPIGLEAGINLNAYVGNNPINLIDPLGLSGAPNEDALKWKQQIESQIQFDKDARAAYIKFGSNSKNYLELEKNVTNMLENKYGKGSIEAAGYLDPSSGKTVVLDDPNPYTREATRLHECDHQKRNVEAIAKYGYNSPAHKKWYYDPKNWADREVKAQYTVSITYLEQILRQIYGSK
jgi:hypothetical protein